MNTHCAREPRNLTFCSVILQAIAICLVFICAHVMGGEADPTAPALPGDGKVEIKPDTNTKGTRPRTKYWLDDPVAKSKDADSGKIPEPADGNMATSEGYKSPRDGSNDNLVLPGKRPPLTESYEKFREAAEEHRTLVSQSKANLRDAKLAYKEKDYQRAFDIAEDVIRSDPSSVEAAEMRRNARGHLDAKDEKIAEFARDRIDRSRILQSDEEAAAPLPKIPTERPHLATRNDDPSIARRRKIAEALEQPITASFQKADLDFVMNTLYDLTGVNIIADPAALDSKTITMHVNDLKLREILEYIVRNNDGISYNITEDSIWITASSETDLKKIMFPRVYPLHYGLVSTVANSGGGGGGGGGRGGSGTNGRSGRGGGQQQGGGNRGGGGQGAQGGQQQEPTYIETVLKWMKDTKSQYVLPEGSDYQIDRQSNLLIVLTTPAGHERVSQFLDFFDQPAIQCLIKTRFLDIQWNSELSLGANLNSLSNRVGTLFRPDGKTPSSTSKDPANGFTLSAGNGVFTTAGTPGATVLSLVGRKTDPAYQLTIAALETSDKTKILSAPQVLAINNKEAVIDVTTHFSYITDLRPIQSTTTAGVGTAIQSTSGFIPEFDEENIGFTLTVTPSIGRDLKTINLHLNPIIDSLAQGQNISQFQTFAINSTTDANNPPTIQRPTIDQTSLETDVVLEDNGYCIIGGLIRNRTETQNRSIPGLSKIPVLGNLFKSLDKTKQKSNLMIIVEASIISPSGRSYYTKPAIDEVDIREGSSNKAPGQVNDKFPIRQPFSPSYSPAPFEGGICPTSQNGDTRKAVPFSSDPKKAYAQTVEMANAQRNSVTIDRGERVTALSNQERMERLANSARKIASARPANGWTVPHEEEIDAPAAAKAPNSSTAGELVPLK